MQNKETSISVTEALRLSKYLVTTLSAQWAYDLWRKLPNLSNSYIASEPRWNIALAIGAAYEAGRVQGIREERQRKTRKKV